MDQSSQYTPEEIQNSNSAAEYLINTVQHLQETVAEQLLPTIVEQDTINVVLNALEQVYQDIQRQNPAVDIKNLVGLARRIIPQVYLKEYRLV